MPNWCENKLTLRFEKDEDIERDGKEYILEWNPSKGYVGITEALPEDYDEYKDLDESLLMLETYELELVCHSRICLIIWHSTVKPLFGPWFVMHSSRVQNQRSCHVSPSSRMVSS